MSSTHWLLAAGLGIALSGCADEEIRSDHNTEGPPRVITAMVGSESAGSEVATFCSTAEGEKLNESVCDEDGAEKITDAVALGILPIPYAALPGQNPDVWRVRLVFNEILDADLVEDLLTRFIDLNHNGVQDDTDCTTDCESILFDSFDNELAYGSLGATQPAVLTCGGNAIAYDGWYDPSGSHLTNPPGPALIVYPLDLVATGTACEISLRPEKVKDKEGNSISATEKFSFDITKLAVRTAAGTVDKPTEGQNFEKAFNVEFTSNIDAATLADKITLEIPGDPPTAVPDLKILTAADDDTISANVFTVQPADDMGVAINFNEETVYKLTVASGIADIKGGTSDADYVTLFKTTKMMASGQ